MIDRRSLIAGGAAVAGLAGLPAFAGAATAYAPIRELARGDATLLPGPALAQFDATLSALLAMDEGELLRPFREAAGMKVGEARLGGWYDRSPLFDPPKTLTGFIPGHSFGQYVSALARAHAATDDARAKAKVERLVAGFVPTIGAAFWRDYPLPAYTYDKLLIGLLDASALAGSREALRLVGPVTDAALPFLPARALDRQLVERQPHRNVAFGWDESYTLAENLYLAADRGAGPRFRTMAPRYLADDFYFAPLAAGRNVLPGRHAYSHVNALASAMRAWFEAGDPMHLAAARNGLGFVIDQSFATGGWGPNEGFVRPGSGGLGDSLASSHGSFETPCGCYGHFKVARALIRATGESRWGDSMERLLYNAALGALPLKPDGTAFYYSDYNEAGRKTYYEQKCPCCSGTIGQLTGDYAISAWLADGRGLYANLYIPSRALWRRADGTPALAFVQEGGAYPLGDDVRMRVEAKRPAAMALRLRIPAWAGPASRLSVNGRDAGALVPGRFHELARVWRDGDVVALKLDRVLRAEPVDAQHPDRVAMVQGPLALFATGGTFRSYSAGDLSGLRQAAGGDVWRLPGDASGPAFRPFFAIGGETTRLYQHLG